LRSGHSVGEKTDLLKQLWAVFQNLINLSSAGHRFANVDLQDPNFQRSLYDRWVAYGRSKTANILFAVAFDLRHRGHGIRAAAVHQGGIQALATLSR
jgi:NAD(P)-dependent dehydrogenase (short-subunit alcohol dehydrogenase family)